MINLEKIKKAHEAISPHINRTPLILSNYLSKDRIVKLKLESLQITNSFKLRGATNKLLSLDNEQKQNETQKKNTETSVEVEQVKKMLVRPTHVNLPEKQYQSITGDTHSAEAY